MVGAWRVGAYLNADVDVAGFGCDEDCVVQGIGASYVGGGLLDDDGARVRVWAFGDDGHGCCSSNALRCKQMMLR